MNRLCPEVSSLLPHPHLSHCSIVHISGDDRAKPLSGWVGDLWLKITGLRLVDGTCILCVCILPLHTHAMRTFIACTCACMCTTTLAMYINHHSVSEPLTCLLYFDLDLWLVHIHVHMYLTTALGNSAILGVDGVAPYTQRFCAFACMHLYT